ncbi:hypothetical protein OIA45_32785 [Streptomyces chartreusis]|uniref:hypothetical protein n=1 Tax=Streptomyces chartreusis TaxID=1969 RepID=UPI003862E9BE|nr:hypothetical protein OIA45_32785 [Streptomyces chartreusis]
MSSPPSEPLPDVSGAGHPRSPGPLGRAAAVLLRALRRCGKPLARRTGPRHRLGRDLDACRQERDRWRRHADSYERELTRTRHERAHLLAWLAALHPSSAVLTPDAGSGPDGPHLLCVEAGGRQVSWRLSPADLPLFAHVPYAQPVIPDSPAPPDQTAHIRRHTRLLAMEGTLFGATAETWAAVMPLRPGEH